jgi:Protein of unknown function (DUF1173)
VAAANCASGYVSRELLFCACVAPSTEAPMHLAQAHGTCVAKAMPSTGPRHASTCDEYREPEGLSSHREVAGAIREDLQAIKNYRSLDSSP